MDKLETFLELLKQKYANRESDDPIDYYSVLGVGYFSLVLNVDGAAYKITTEKNYNTHLEIAQMTNMLLDMGVNVPKIYYVNAYNDDKDYLEVVKYLADRKSYDDFIKELDEVMDAYRGSYLKNSTNFCGIYLQKIAGDVPFNAVPKYVVDTVLYNEERIKAVSGRDISAAGRIVKRVRNDINEKLDYFLNIPDEHYIKFFTDALTISNMGIALDNVTKKNFVYNKNKGFYFLDLGIGDREYGYYDDMPWSSPFSCTIENVLGQVAYPPYYFDENEIEKCMELYVKMYSCLKDCYLQNIKNAKTTREIREYFEIMKNGGYYKAFESFLDRLPANAAEEYKRKFAFCDSVIKANRLKAYGEPELE